VLELELVGDVSLADIDVDARRWISAECDALYSLGAVLYQMYGGRRASKRVVGTTLCTGRVRSHEHVVDWSCIIITVIILTTLF